MERIIHRQGRDLEGMGRGLLVFAGKMNEAMFWKDYLHDVPSKDYWGIVNSDNGDGSSEDCLSEI